MVGILDSPSVYAQMKMFSRKRLTSLELQILRNLLKINSVATQPFILIQWYLTTKTKQYFVQSTRPKVCSCFYQTSLNIKFIFRITGTFYVQNILPEKFTDIFHGYKSFIVAYFILTMTMYKK